MENEIKKIKKIVKILHDKSDLFPRIEIDKEGYLRFHTRQSSLRSSKPVSKKFNTSLPVKDFLSTDHWHQLLRPEAHFSPVLTGFTGVAFKYPKDVLAEITKISSIAKKESPRNYATVLCFSSDGITATDGFRLATIAFKTEVLTESITLPVASAKALAAMTSDVTITLSADRTAMHVRCDDDDGPLLIVRTSAIKYPNYKNVFPKEKNLTSFEIAPKELAKALPKEKDQPVRLEQDKVLWLEKEYKTDRPCVTATIPFALEGIKVPFTLNSSFLGESLKIAGNTARMLVHPTKDDEPCLLISGLVTQCLVPILFKE